ncbi:MAG TPA: hypothetical protein VLZ81_06400, partial [Blastocatellia bacterium]|nr:hypothetical protein [Blastocatellia bacterium]
FYEAWAGMKGPWRRIERTAADCLRLSPERLDEARELMDESKFEREYLCKFTEAAGQYFSEESIERAFRTGNKRTEDGDPYGSLSDLFGEMPKPYDDLFDDEPTDPEARRAADEMAALAAEALLELGGDL